MRDRGMNAKCFFITPTGMVQRYLRRYASTRTCPAMPGAYSYHQTMVPLDIIPEDEIRFERTMSSDMRGISVKQLDAAWPKFCVCGYEFEQEDEWQVFPDHIYKREDTGETTTLKEAPPGAMWFADWSIYKADQNWWRGPDGHCLMIRGFYNDDFCPDQRAKNCTLPADDNHKCWVRVGTVPNITIGKDGGPTCAAGAGSFYFGKNADGSHKWHGFCRNGELVQG